MTINELRYVVSTLCADGFKVKGFIGEPLTLISAYDISFLTLT